MEFLILVAVASSFAAIVGAVIVTVNSLVEGEISIFDKPEDKFVMDLLLRPPWEWSLKNGVLVHSPSELRVFYDEDRVEYSTGGPCSGGTKQRKVRKLYFKLYSELLTEQEIRKGD